MHVIWRIALYAALPSLVVNLVLYLWRLRRGRQCDRGEIGLLNALWAFSTECVALSAAVLLIPFGWAMRTCKAGGARGPVILLPGWGLNRGSLWLLRRRLRRDGWGPVCSLSWPAWTADIEGATRAVQKIIDEIAPAPTLLVAHGFGGLVARNYLRRYPARNVRRLITLGTPHAGTETARLLGALARSMVPDSKLLRTLGAADRIPRQFDVISISSRFDAVVLPWNHAEYPGAFNARVDAIGHFALLFSPKIYRLIEENLRAPLG